MSKKAEFVRSFMTAPEVQEVVTRLLNRLAPALQYDQTMTQADLREMIELRLHYFAVENVDRQFYDMADRSNLLRKAHTSIGTQLVHAISGERSRVTIAGAREPTPGSLAKYLGDAQRSEDGKRVAPAVMVALAEVGTVDEAEALACWCARSKTPERQQVRGVDRMLPAHQRFADRVCLALHAWDGDTTPAPRALSRPGRTLHRYLLGAYVK